MKLHQNKELFKNYIDLVSQSKNISEDIVIKDYFVTMSLKMIFSNFEDIVFIGGTSLSKCFNLIKRFSEDIDLVAVASSKKAKQRKTHEVIMFLIENWEYDVDYVGDLGQIHRDFKKCYLKYEYDSITELDHRVQVELISFTEPFPTERVMVTSLINEFLDIDEIHEYDMTSFEVVCQSPIRTLIEKISIQKEYAKDYENDNLSPDENPEKRARDYYDIHKIWQYVGKSFQGKENYIKQMINSRVNNRKQNTSVDLNEYNKYSLLDLYKNNNIKNTLEKVDNIKLSIRDLDTLSIEVSLEEIDLRLKDIL